MSRVERIKGFMKFIASQCDIAFVRADQSGKRPHGIFMAYKIINTDEEPNFQVIETQEDSNPNADSFKRYGQLSNESIVSVTVFGPEKEYNLAWGKALQLHNHIRDFNSMSSEYEELTDGALQNMGFKIVGAITDRAAFLETKYEARVGFDFKVSDSSITERMVDVVNIPATLEEMF